MDAGFPRLAENCEINNTKINMPKLSIIVPVYNAEKSLPICLDSLLSQTMTDINFWLVNDGSTDNSLEVCQQELARLATMGSTSVMEISLVLWMLMTGLKLICLKKCMMQPSAMIAML